MSGERVGDGIGHHAGGVPDDLFEDLLERAGRPAAGGHAGGGDAPAAAPAPWEHETAARLTALPGQIAELTALVERLLRALEAVPGVPPDAGTGHPRA